MSGQGSCAVMERGLKRKRRIAGILERGSDLMPIVAHRIQLLPNQRAENYFRQACGTARWVYNWALDEWERITAAGGKPNVNEIDRRFNAIKRNEFPWMFGEDGKLVVSNDVGQRVILKDLKNAFRRFFDNVQQGRRVGNAENPYGYPRRKKKEKG